MVSPADWITVTCLDGTPVPDMVTTALLGYTLWFALRALTLTFWLPVLLLGDTESQNLVGYRTPRDIGSDIETGCTTVCGPDGNCIGCQFDKLLARLCHNNALRCNVGEETVMVAVRETSAVLASAVRVRVPLFVPLEGYLQPRLVA